MFVMMFAPVARRIFLQNNVTSHFNFQNKSFGVKRISVYLNQSLTQLGSKSVHREFIMDKVSADLTM